MDIGSAVGRRRGVTDQQIMELAYFETSPAFTELEKLVLRYAIAMTEAPVEVPDELFARLREHLDERQMVELTSAIAWENYRARYNRAFGIEAEGFSEGAAQAAPAFDSHAATGAAD
jgi:alkylhydroperoxidase family enzyme